MTLTAPEAPSQADFHEPASNRTKIIAGGVVAALLLGGAGYKLLGGGGSEDAALSSPVVPHVVKPKVAVKPAAKAVKPAAKIPAASTVKLGRDPFLALYRVPPVVTTPTTSTPTTTGTAPTGTTTGSTDGSSTPTTPTSSPYALKLTSIKGTDAKLYTFSVAGTTKTVVAAQKFGKYGELVVLAYLKDARGNPIGALLQVGDDDPVGVKVGERITVL